MPCPKQYPFGYGRYVKTVVATRPDDVLHGTREAHCHQYTSGDSERTVHLIATCCCSLPMRVIREARLWIEVELVQQQEWVEVPQAVPTDAPVNHGALALSCRSRQNYLMSSWRRDVTHNLAQSPCLFVCSSGRKRRCSTIKMYATSCTTFFSLFFSLFLSLSLVLSLS